MQVNQHSLKPGVELEHGENLSDTPTPVIHTRKLYWEHLKERDFFFLSPVARGLHRCPGEDKVPSGSRQGLSMSPMELVPFPRPVHPGKLSSVSASNFSPLNTQ